MSLLKTMGLAACLGLAISPSAEAGTPSKTSTKPKVTASAKKTTSRASTSKKKSSKRRTARRPRGQQAIESARATQIQEALIAAGYLKGEPTGKMDAATKAAFVKLQSENGWQTRVVPDSRALIKLGLGPDHSNLLNPDTAMLPGSTASASAAQAGQQ